MANHRLRKDYLNNQLCEVTFRKSVPMLTQEKKHQFPRNNRSLLFDRVSRVEENVSPTTYAWSSLFNFLRSLSRLFFHKGLHINTNLRGSLEKIGISTFQDFINFSTGQLVSRSSKRPVRKLYLDVDGQIKKYFLKQASLPSFYVGLKAWCRLQAVQSETVRELLLITLFRYHGIPVMAPVGWGTYTVFGWPVSGFLLVEEVVGREFVEVYCAASLQSRRRLMRAHGELMGTLHKKGIESKVHPKDLICISEDYRNFQKCLVVIDRERGESHTVNISFEHRAKRLAEIWIKGSFMIDPAERSELLAFLSGYWAASHMPSHGKNVRQRFVAFVIGYVADILARDERFAHLRSPFKEKYDIPLKSD